MGKSLDSEILAPEVGHDKSMQLWKTTDNTEEIIRNKITWLSFFLCCLVFFIHSNNVDTYGIKQDSVGVANLVFWIEYYGVIITQIAVPGFFLISGFLFFRTFVINKLGEKLRNRMGTIAIPYIIWCSVYYFYQIAYTNIPIINNHISSSGVVEFGILEWLLSLGPNSYYTLWFLKNLIIFIALTPVEYYLLKNYKKIPTGLVVVVLLWLVEYEKIIPIHLPSGMAIYSIGAYIGINRKELVYRKNILFTVVSAIYLMVHAITRFKYLRMLGIVAMVLAIWFLLDVIGENLKVRSWMKYSFFYYVSHDLVLQVIKKLFYVLGGCKPAVAGISYFFSPILTMTVLIIVACSMSRRVPKIWKVITGRSA